MNLFISQIIIGFHCCRHILLTYSTTDNIKTIKQRFSLFNKTFYSPYYLCLQAKQECYSPGSWVPVRRATYSLIDNTVMWLSNFLGEVLLTLEEEEGRNYLNRSCDGSRQPKDMFVFRSI